VALERDTSMKKLGSKNSLESISIDDIPMGGINTGKKTQDFLLSLIGVHPDEILNLDEVYVHNDEIQLRTQNRLPLSWIYSSKNSFLRNNPYFISTERDADYTYYTFFWPALYKNLYHIVRPYLKVKWSI
jgi:hypothetical protein